MDACPSRVLAGIVLLCALVASAPPAFAGDWSLPVEGGTPVLTYGTRYAGGVHRGVDLAADAGAEVAAPASGTVAFAGQVPADGGGTCGAVTIVAADGSKISLLPLDMTFAAQGDSLAAGDVVGSLAGTGDDSVSDPHLHLSVRQGDLYIDPTGFLPAGDNARNAGSGETLSELDGQSEGEAGSGATAPPAPDTIPMPSGMVAASAVCDPGASSTAPQPAGSTVAPVVVTDVAAPNGADAVAIDDLVVTEPSATRRVVSRMPIECAGLSQAASSAALGGGGMGGPARRSAPIAGGGVAVATLAVFLMLLAVSGRLSVTVARQHEESSEVSERWGRPHCGAVGSLVHFGSFISCSGPRLQKSRGRFSPREVNC